MMESPIFLTMMAMAAPMIRIAHPIGRAPRRQPNRKGKIRVSDPLQKLHHVGHMAKRAGTSDRSRRFCIHSVGRKSGTDR
jgi:hypothetical protein